MSLSEPPLLPPPLNNTTKPKRSVSFLNHDLVSSSNIKSSSKPARSSFQPGKRKGYVRKGPIQSDSEDDEDEAEDEGHDRNDQDEQDQEDKDELEDEGKRQINGSVYLANQRPVARSQGGRPGQNYVRKTPVNSDTESEEETEEDRYPKPTTSKQFSGNRRNDASDSEDEIGDDKDVEILAGPLSRSRISGPGQNYVRKKPVNSDTESDEEKLDKRGTSTSATQSVSTSGLKIAEAFAKLGEESPKEQSSRPASLNRLASQESATSTPSPLVSSHLPQAMGITVPVPVSAASLAGPMAIYQQQQQEMMIIMQQQQIQIATMQQQQQAYQLLVLQQQQQQQQHQLQAVPQQHSRSPSLNGSIQIANNDDDDDDDVPLSEKKQQLPHSSQFSSLAGYLPGTPPLQQLPVMHGALPAVHLSLDMQPVSGSNPYSPLQQPTLPHSRQLSGSSVHSINSGYPVPLMNQGHFQLSTSSPLNPASSSPLLQPQHFYQPHYHHQHSHSFSQLQPRLANFIEEEQERMRQEQHGLLTGTPCGAQLLTSSFPAGYRNSMGSTSLSQLNPDRASMGSLQSAGSNGSGNGITAPRPSSSRHSLLPHPQPTLIQSISPSSSPSPLPPHSHQTLIHVEAKPPPPQTGLVGTITAMEREKKLAKSQGTNQLQFQHQQYQQQLMVNAEKERWLQEQRRLAWEAENTPQQYHQYQQQQQQQPSQFILPVIPSVPLWTVEDEEDDNPTPEPTLNAFNPSETTAVNPGTTLTFDTQTASVVLVETHVHRSGINFDTLCCAQLCLCIECHYQQCGIFS
ncbi:hypothetical protein EDD11_001870 [Mortierella claussenii]|nr:hypothetical protein EDD11_001870 [Mortierella claussenii]